MFGVLTNVEYVHLATHRIFWHVWRDSYRTVCTEESDL